MLFSAGLIKQLLWFLILAAILIAAAFAAFTIYERRQSEATISAGAIIYAENCASCHGADLKGQPDWKTPNADGTLPAPPHDEDGHTWHHDDNLLLNYIKLGGTRAMARDGMPVFKSGMPAYEDILSEWEIEAVLYFIKSRWPEKIRQIQQERTRMAEQGHS